MTHGKKAKKIKIKIGERQKPKYARTTQSVQFERLLQLKGDNLQVC